MDRFGHRVMHRLATNDTRNARLQAAVVACLVAVSGVAFSFQDSATRPAVEFLRQSVEVTADKATHMLARSVVATRVAIALENANGLNETSIDFKMDGERVTLIGEVRHPAEATLAEYVVLEVKGVSEVDNNLIVVRK